MVVRLADRAGPRRGWAVHFAACRFSGARRLGLRAHARHDTVAAGPTAPSCRRWRLGLDRTGLPDRGRSPAPTAYDCPDGAPRNGSGSSAPGAPSPITRCCWSARSVADDGSGLRAENTFGLWTFAVLYFARISAKLNLFFGVPKINTEFLPEALGICQPFPHSPAELAVPDSVTAPLPWPAGWNAFTRRVQPARNRGLCPADRHHRAGASRTLADGAAAARCQTLALDAARAQTNTRHDKTGGTHGF
jgi:hypothetical protein